MKISHPKPRSRYLKRWLLWGFGVLALSGALLIAGLMVLVRIFMPFYPTEGPCGLHYAIVLDQPEVAEKLIQEGHATCPCQGRGPVSGVDDDFYPIHSATSYCRLELLKKMLEAGADPNSRTRTGITPVMVFAGYAGDDCLECLKHLIRYGADVTLVDDRGESALHEVAESDNVETAKLLLEHGAEINLETKKEQTPLHVAAGQHYEPRKSMVSFLLEHGGDPTLKDHDGMRPIDLAIAAQNEEIVLILKEFEANIVEPDVGEKDEDSKDGLHDAH